MTKITKNLNNTTHPEISKHYFYGDCAPGNPGVFKYVPNATFSVGVFEWVPKASGNGGKRGPVKVRVSGLCRLPYLVYIEAQAIAEALDRGDYKGNKYVKIK